MKSLPHFRALPRSFYGSSAKLVAPALLGHWLLRRLPGGLCGGRIVETEAYLRDDPACHGAPGLTARNKVMFGPPGHAYVYLIYGFHFCVNAVCQPPGVAEAVLLRAVEVQLGEELMRARRSVSEKRHLTNGPGKLCQAMGIDREFDGADLCDVNGPLFIAEAPDSSRRYRTAVLTTPRIGLTRAAELPLRFHLADSEFLSRPQKRGC